MDNINRRAWLKNMGLVGVSSLIATTHATELLAGEPNKLSDGNIRLSSNENPYGPSEKVRKAVIKSFDETCRYPGMFLRDLRAQIAAREGVSEDCIVICGGSTEGLKVTGACYGMYGGEIIAARPTFLAMMDHAELFGATVNWVDVKSDMTVDLDAMLNRINNQTRLIFLCNPNNPTSTIVEKNALRSFCKEASERTLVFSDEAYYDFIEEKDYPSMVELVKEDRNVIVSRTFSKVYGLAGFRIGYLIARPDIASKLRDHVVAFTNVPAIVAASEAMKDDAFYTFSLQKNKEGKEMIYQTLDKLSLKYVKSHTNFVFFESGRDIGKMNAYFSEKGIQIGRPFPPFTNWCRISTGKLEEVSRFCDTLKKMYS